MTVCWRRVHGGKQMSTTS